MADDKIVLKLRDETKLEVFRLKLTANSKTFRYLIDELHQHELLFDDFQVKIVGLFITSLEDLEIAFFNEGQFREMNKLSIVFEVEWLINSCRQWLEDKINEAKTDEEKTFVFEECLYILKKWNQSDEMDSLLSELASQDNTSFLSQYMADLERLDTIQLDLLLKLGRSDVEVFLARFLRIWRVERNFIRTSNIFWST